MPERPSQMPLEQVQLGSNFQDHDPFDSTTTTNLNLGFYDSSLAMPSLSGITMTSAS